MKAVNAARAARPVGPIVPIGPIATRIAALLAAMLAIGPGARAESIFSSVGFGRWNPVVDTRSAAMGDVSIVAPGEWGHSPRNPALAALIDKPTIHFSFRSDLTRVDAGDGTETRPDARVPLVGGALPLHSRIVAAVYVYDLNDPRYDISQPVDGDPPYALLSRGEGAWTQVGFTLAARIGDGALGVQLGVPISSFREEFTRDFSTSGYSDRSEVLKTKLEAMQLITFGGHVRLGPAGAGAFFQLPSSGELVSELQLRGEDAGVVRSPIDFELPGMFGAGLSLDVNPALTVCGEWRHDDWEATRFDGRNWRESAGELGLTRAFKDVDAFGFGVEWRRAGEGPRTIWKDLSLRAGASYEPWPVAGPEHGRIADKSLSAGIGVPFIAGSGELDFTLRYTQRREDGSDLKENVFSFALGLSLARQPRGY